MQVFQRIAKPFRSLSARRAWIEMLAPRLVDMSAAVALRKESVDRNKQIIDLKAIDKRSLSARRAWIEISVKGLNAHLYYVALRKESVDRNRCSIKCAICRIKSLSARRAWIEIFAPSENMEARRVSLSARRAWIEIRHRVLKCRKSRSRSPQGERG